MRNGSAHRTNPNSVRRAGEAGRRGQKRRGRRNGRSWGAARAGSRRGEGRTERCRRDRSRRAGWGCGTAACTVQTRTLSGVRERLGDEGTERRGRWNGRSWGAAETGAGGAKAEATGAGQKDAGRDRSRDSGGDAERQHAQYGTELCPACGRGWKTRAEAEGTAERSELGSGGSGSRRGEGRSDRDRTERCRDGDVADKKRPAGTVSRVSAGL